MTVQGMLRARACSQKPLAAAASAKPPVRRRNSVRLALAFEAHDLRAEGAEQVGMAPRQPVPFGARRFLAWSGRRAARGCAPPGAGAGRAAAARRRRGGAGGRGGAAVPARAVRPAPRRRAARRGRRRRGAGAARPAAAPAAPPGRAAHRAAAPRAPAPAARRAGVAAAAVALEDQFVLVRHAQPARIVRAHLEGPRIGFDQRHRPRPAACASMPQTSAAPTTSAAASPPPIAISRQGGPPSSDGRTR